jgi:glycosyltransferase involved in cell wall biosynthesis
LTSLPRISIIIPALQEEKLITRTLKQFTPELRQRYNFEVIVSDGGSTDKTVELANDYADIVIEHTDAMKQNISRGRNVGAKSASGEILIFLNADTLIEEPASFFQKMIDLVNNSRNIAATCSVLVYPAEETVLDRVFHNFFNWYFWMLNIVGMGMGRGECHVMKKETFEKIGGYDEKIAAGEDYEMFLRLRRKGKIAFVRSVLVYESPRRYRKYGYARISLLWFLNAFMVLFFQRSMVKEWAPIR